MRYGPYPLYKDSGVEWLCEVPEHWLDRKIARDIPFVVGWTPPSGNDEYYDGELPWVTIADMTQQSVDDTSSKISLKAVQDKGAKIVPAGSMLFSFKLTVGRVAFLTAASYTNEAIAAFLPSGPLDLQYWKYAAPEFIPKYGRENIYGALLLNQELISSVRFFAPDKTEQTQIARFLDHETGKIDSLIAEQEKLIELLKEKRQALALQAYLDSDSMELRLGNALDVIARPVQYKSEQEYVALGIYNRGRGLFHKEPKPQEELGDSDFFVIEEGDLILSGQFAWEGSVALAGPSETGTIVSHRYPVIRGKSHICLTEYVFALLTTREGDFLLNECSRGAAGRNRPLNIGALLKEKIKIPSMALQHKIVSFVHEEKKLLSEIKATIKLLEERRSALISSVVTGKIDVRNWEPQGEAE